MSSQLSEIRKGTFELTITDDIPKRVGVIILLITFGLFGTWAYTAPIDGAALAPGEVTVKNYRKTVQHLEGGIVKSLQVSDGASVKKNQPLIVLDDTQYTAELGIVRGQIIALSATQARLKAERDLADELTFPEHLSDDNDIRVREAVANETALFDARTSAQTGQVDVLEKRIAQIEEQVRGTEQIITSKVKLIASYESELADLNELLKDGFVDVKRVRDIERRIAETRSEIANYKSSIAQSDVKISETKLQIVQLNKEFRTDVVNQLTQVEAQLFDLREREQVTLARLERTVIQAPESGMVLGLKVHTEGGVIRAGEPLLDIVPDSSELWIEARVNPIDIDRVQVGTIADIRFSAFKSATTPVIEGRVVQISADRLTDPNTGAPYYLAKVEVTKAGQAQLSELTLVPGMPAEVLINTGERTLLQYLIQPATNAFARSFIED